MHYIWHLVPYYTLRTLVSSPMVYFHGIWNHLAVSAGNFERHTQKREITMCDTALPGVSNVYCDPHLCVLSCISPWHASAWSTLTYVLAGSFVDIIHHPLMTSLVLFSTQNMTYHHFF